MSTNKKFFMSIDIMDAKYLHGIIMDEYLHDIIMTEYTSGHIIDIFIHINDYKNIILFNINKNNNSIELSYYNTTHKYINSYLLYSNS